MHLQSCNVETDMTLIREPIWAYLHQHCNSFATMSVDAVFSDIFKLSTVGVMTQELESLFWLKRVYLLFISLAKTGVIPYLTFRFLRQSYQVAKHFSVVCVNSILGMFQCCNILLSFQNFYL